MNLYHLVLRNMKQRMLASVLTVVSIALGVGLAVGILVVRAEVEDSFYNPKIGWDVIVGPGGVSDLQLVLSSVLNVQGTTAKLPYSFYEELLKDDRIDFAIPFCSGDTYQNFRIVATTEEFFKKFEYEPGYRSFNDEGEEVYLPGKKLQLADGRFFSDELGEAVVGAFVARKTRLGKLGAKFVITHGMNIDDGVPAHKHEEQPFEVVGVLKPTGTPVDKVIYVSLRTWFCLSGHAEGAEQVAALKAAKAADHAHETPAEHEAHGEHDEEHEDHDHEDHHDHEVGPDKWEVSSIGVRFKDPFAGQQYVWELRNSSTVAQAVAPLQRLTLFFEGTLSHILYAFFAIAVMVIAVSAIGIMVWIYNSMNERRRDVAIMRSLGASRWTIVATVLLESATLLALGALVGLPLGHLGVQGASGFVQAQSGAIFNAWRFSIWELYVVLGTTVLGVVVGILPAFKAYKTEVAENLTPLA